ncbi:MAG: hypothetical protein RL033_384, partial [Pseudomonadota bacterium]
MFEPMAEATTAPGTETTATDARVIDPVCGMKVNPATARGGGHEHEGVTYYFCNPKCRERFRAEPERFLAARAAAEHANAHVHGAGHAAHGAGHAAHGAAPALEVGVPHVAARAPQEAVAAWYVCPMDPEVRQLGPGSCPKCGMALEPELPSALEEENPELEDMTRRFWWSAAFTLPTFALAMSDLLPGQPVQQHLSGESSAWIQLALAAPVVLWGGLPFFQRGWVSLRQRSLNMFTLIALGTATAFGFSVLVTLWPDVVHSVMRGAGHAGPPVYFEAAAVIITLVL